MYTHTLYTRTHTCTLNLHTLVISHTHVHAHTHTHTHTHVHAHIIYTHAHMHIEPAHACNITHLRRKEYQPHKIRWEEVKEESVTGKQMIYFVPDKSGRPIVLMRPRCVCVCVCVRLLKWCDLVLGFVLMSYVIPSWCAS